MWFHFFYPPCTAIQLLTEGKIYTWKCAVIQNLDPSSSIDPYEAKYEKVASVSDSGLLNRNVFYRLPGKKFLNPEESMAAKLKHERNSPCRFLCALDTV